MELRTYHQILQLFVELKDVSVDATHQTGGHDLIDFFYRCIIFVIHIIVNAAPNELPEASHHSRKRSPILQRSPQSNTQKRSKYDSSHITKVATTYDYLHCTTLIKFMPYRMLMKELQPCLELVSVRFAIMAMIVNWDEH